MKRALLLITAVVLAGCSSSATPVPTAAPTVAGPTAAAPTAAAATVAPTMAPADITIAYSGYSTSNTYWNILGKSAASEAAAKGVKFVDVTATVNDAPTQLAAVNSELSQKPSALIIGSVNNSVFGTTIATAKAAGIPILAVDTGIDDPYISALIQTDNEGAGKLIGAQICTDTGGKGTVLVLGGTVGAQSGDARKKGVEETITACGLKDDGQYGNWDAVTDVSIATSTIASTPDLVAIFVPHSDGAAAVAKAVADKGKTSSIKVYGFDGSAAELTDILNGTEAASIHQDNVGMGKTIVDDAITILQGGAVPKTVLIVPVLINKANAASFQ
jgi:ribose transport system substrate-binding protein